MTSRENNGSARTVLVSRCYQGVEGVTRYRVVDASGTDIEGPSVGIVGLVHGNEPVGSDLIDRLDVCVVEHLTRGTLLTVRANLEAQQQGARHTISGIDLNRLWGHDSLRMIADKQPADRCYEESRALELSQLLVEMDYILDFHSTTAPTPPFLVFRDDQAHALIGSQLGVSHMVTGLHEGGVLQGGMCPDVALRPAQTGALVGFTYEAGQHQDATNVVRAYQIFIRLLNIHGMWATSADPIDEGFEHQVFEVMAGFKQSTGGKSSWRFVGHVGGEPGFGRQGSPRHLASFEGIEAGELVLRRGKAGVYRAQSAFTILLPTPNAAAGTDLFYVAQRRHGGIIFGESLRTDEEAQREAVAVERMLDNVDDDAFERGETWVSFETNSVLDQCADMAARTLRLPIGHPNRCVTVLGRGDWGTGETRQRIGRRYRQVMTDLLEGGVPIQRYQLMRGATLSWFRALTSEKMSRSFASDEAGCGSALFLSKSQPHTLSLLIVGDIERALKTGSARGVRIAVLVEAATIEPGDTAVSVNVARMAIFSSRPEILAMTQFLLRELRNEHATMIDRHTDQSAPTNSFKRDAQSGILPWRKDEQRLALRRYLLNEQEQRFRRVLSEANPVNGAPLTRPEWMARLMVESGIMDVVAVDNGTQPCGDGFVIDVDAMIKRTPSNNGVGGEKGVAVDLVEPVHAKNVSADLLQRWLGWKRFVRHTQVIPGNRGMDVDLAFSELFVCNKLSDWFDDARRWAQETPGDTLVIIASDGHLPSSADSLSGNRLHHAHQRLLEDTNVAYLRLQHAQGTTSDWMSEFLASVRRRGDEGAPVSFGWEIQHGMSMSLFVVATRADVTETSTRYLDEWDFKRCGILILPTRSQSDGRHLIGMFTESTPTRGRRRNHELLYFGRKHVEGLLAQARVSSTKGGWQDFNQRLSTSTVGVFTGWVSQVRQSTSRDQKSAPVPAQWVADTLGIVDTDLAAALAMAANGPDSAGVAAESVWWALDGR